MRYVVKQKETGCFLSSTGGWTKYLSEAERFPNGLSLNLHLEGIRHIVLDVEVLELPAR